MIGRVRSVLVEPARAFATDGDGGRTGQAPSSAEGDLELLGPALIVVAYGTVGIATVAPVLVALTELLPVTPPVSVAVGTEEVAVPSLLVAIVGLGVPALLLVWLFVGVVTFAGARLLGGEGGWRETLAFVGWGFLPKLLGALALGLVLFAYSSLDPQVTFVEALVGAREDVDVGPLSIEGPGGSLFLVVTTIEVLASAWTAYVWYGGLQAVQAVERRRAIGMAVVLFVLFNGV